MTDMHFSHSGARDNDEVALSIWARATAMIPVNDVAFRRNCQ
jgi:hypothetical protein